MTERSLKTICAADIPPYEPPCTIEVADKHFAIFPQGRFNGMYGKDGYQIEKSSASTPGKVLGWMNHLSGKKWMDAYTIVWFANVAFAELGFEMDYRIG